MAALFIWLLRSYERVRALPFTSSHRAKINRLAAKTLSLCLHQPFTGRVGPAPTAPEKSSTNWSGIYVGADQAELPGSALTIVDASKYETRGWQDRRRLCRRDLAAAGLVSTLMRMVTKKASLGQPEANELRCGGTALGACAALAKGGILKRSDALLGAMTERRRDHRW
jgi:hypothetical protein